jgi:hypothetical protein
MKSLAVTLLETSKQTVLHKDESFLGCNYLHNGSGENDACQVQEESSTENQSIRQQTKASVTKIVGSVYQNWRE